MNDDLTGFRIKESEDNFYTLLKNHIELQAQEERQKIVEEHFAGIPYETIICILKKECPEHFI